MRTLQYLCVLYQPKDEPIGIVIILYIQSNSWFLTFPFLQSPETMVDELGALMNKYEVPMGLMNKLMMLSEYQVLEFMIDDSGSMTLTSDTVDKQGRPQTRWAEAHILLKEMIEILAHVPFNQIAIVFLNRPDVVALQRNGRDPKTFLADAYRQIDGAFVRPPQGTTPYMEKIKKSLSSNPGMNIARWFFGDGVPNGGVAAQKEITRMLVQRENPAGNPVTFISCTNEDDQVCTRSRCSCLFSLLLIICSMVLTGI